MNYELNIILLGSGNVATHLARALTHAGHTIRQVYSPTLSHASRLASAVGAPSATDRLTDLMPDADLYLLAVSDPAIPELAAHLSRHVMPHAIVVHTAGSMPLTALTTHRPERCGVLYPLQTFSRDRETDLSVVPFLVEATDADTLHAIRRLAHTLTSEVVDADSHQRRRLHLAAVFANNFTNHCYRLAQRISEANGIDFRLLLPLIDETAAKVHDLSPRQAQTGPMARGDLSAIDRHLPLIDDAHMREVYETLSRSIYDDSHVSTSESTSDSTSESSAESTTESRGTTP